MKTRNSIPHRPQHLQDITTATLNQCAPMRKQGQNVNRNILSSQSSLRKEVKGKNIYELHYSPKLTKVLLQESDVREDPLKISSLRSSCQGMIQVEEGLQDKYDQLWEENIMLLRKIDNLTTTNERTAKEIRTLTADFVRSVGHMENICPRLQAQMESYMLAILSITDAMPYGRLTFRKHNCTLSARSGPNSSKFLPEKAGSESTNAIYQPQKSIKFHNLPILIEEDDSSDISSRRQYSTQTILEREEDSQLLSSSCHDHDHDHEQGQDQEQSSIQIQESSVLITSNFVTNKAASKLLQMGGLLQTAGQCNFHPSEESFEEGSKNSISEYYAEQEPYEEEEEQQQQQIEEEQLLMQESGNFSHKYKPHEPLQRSMQRSQKMKSRLETQSVINNYGQTSKNKKSQSQCTEYLVSQVLSRRKIFNSHKN